MKKIISVVFALMFSAFLFAQLQNANWCFGEHAGVNFSSSSVSAFNSALPVYGVNHRVNAGSVSDNYGNLLFYTDGHDVYDKNHTIMPNGTNLYGSHSAPYENQGIVIVPKPGSETLYYIFSATSGCSTNSIPTSYHAGFYYTVVNMDASVNGGNGDVVANLKNIPLANPAGVTIDYDFVNTANSIFSADPRVTSSLSANGDKVWVSLFTIFGDNTTTATRVAYQYLISANGINNTSDGQLATPTNSLTRSNSHYSIYEGERGTIKFSPDGKYLVDATLYYVNLYNFNNSTGDLEYNSNIYFWDLFNPSNQPIYGLAIGGVEFSPNNQLIYFTTTNQTILQTQTKGPIIQEKKYRYLLQYKIGNIVNTNLKLINKFPLSNEQNNSNIITPIPTIQYQGFLQLALDGKIYEAFNMNGNNPHVNYLGAIQNPNNVGLGCNFIENATTLAPNTLSTGNLPQWVHTTAKWPKAYGTKPAFSMLKTENSNNIFVSYPPLPIAPYLNHVGAYPSIPYLAYNLQYSSTGFTSWYSPFNTLFALHNGTIQLSDYNYYNPNPLTTATGPALVPANERILAETSAGSYITATNSNFTDETGYSHCNNIYLRTSLGTLPPISVNGSFGAKFNSFTNKFYFYTSNLLRIYSVSNSGFSLISTLTFTGYISKITPNDKVYVVINGQLKELINNNGNVSYNLVVANGFNNANIGGFWETQTVSDYPYTEYKLIIINRVDNFLYLLDLSNLSVKKIQLSSPSYFPVKYLFCDNNLFLSLTADAPYSIGNQQINGPVTGTLCIFTKLNLQTDFSRVSQNSTPRSNVIIEKSSATFTASISPNPSSNYVRIEIKDGNNEISNDTYNIAFKNKFNNTLLTIKSYQQSNLIDLTSLQKGFYYVEITNSKGETVISKFIKLQ